MSQLAVVYFKVQKPEQSEDIDKFLDELVGKADQIGLDQYDPVIRTCRTCPENGVICTLDYFPPTIEKNQIRFLNDDVDKLYGEFEDKKPNHLTAFEQRIEDWLRAGPRVMNYAFSLYEFVTKKSIPASILQQSSRMRANNFILI